MGFASGDTGKGRGRFFGGSSGLDQINVTPFVDVVLVLLIIFMVTAPFAVSGVNIDLPRNNTDSIASVRDPVIVSISSREEFFLGEEKVAQDQLVTTLKRLAEMQKSDAKAVYIRGDRTAQYGAIMQAMEAAKLAGFTRIGMMGKTSK
jgi:biopolymer transport protein TolR